MKITKTDIIRLFRSGYAEPKETFITDDDILVYWWMALNRFYDEVNAEFTVSEATFPTFVDQPEYPLGADVRAVRAVFSLQSEDWVRLLPLEYTHFLEMPQQDFSSDLATHYYVYKNQLGLYPTPATTSYESLYTGGFTNYNNATFAYWDASPGPTVIDLSPINQWQGKYIDITAVAFDYTETFTISSHTQTGVIVDREPSSPYLKDPASYALTFEIWDYVDNVKVIYSQRPPLPGEDEGRGVIDNLGEELDSFEFDFPEEYLDILMSYMLYKACLKDKLLNDAGFHKNEWEVGLAKAKRSSGRVKDDFMLESRFANDFTSITRRSTLRSNILTVFGNTTRRF